MSVPRLPFSVAVAVVVATSAWTAPVWTGVAWAGQCLSAIESAAQRHGVPSDLMRAVAFVESGRTVNGARTSWPWTMNVEGQGYYFDTRAEAERFAHQTHSQGKTLFDVGCFQINYHWHGEGFPSLKAMFDPFLNAEYAAQFLAALYEEVGDWMTAVGFYHSRTPHHTARYQRAITQAMRSLGGSTRLASVRNIAPRVRFLRPDTAAPSGQIASNIKHVTLQSLAPQTAGGVSIRILTPGSSLIEKRTGRKSRIISFDGGG